MPTNTPKRLLAALILAPTLSSAQVTFDWWDFKEWRQVGPGSNLFLGGWTDVFFQDGSWVLSGCIHPSPVIIPPSLPCPLGTTGFIAQGDVDFDGVNDQGSFWSIAALTRAERIEPFRTDQFKILSAPPSGIADILRGTNGDTAAVFDVIDTSVVIWYNVLAPPVDDYEINRFEAHRHYGPGNSEQQRHYTDVPWGTYQFTLPEINSPFEPPRPVPFAVTHLVTPDAYPGRAAVPQGWQVINDEWFGDEIHFDPRVFYTFEWGGLNFQNALLSDLLFFSMRGNHYVNPQGFTRTEFNTDLLLSGTVTGLDCNTVSTDLDFDVQLEQGSTYEFNITSGDLSGDTEYPVTVFGTGGGLDANELMTVNDLSGGIVTGSFTAAAGLTLTTNRDLLACLTPGQAYELSFGSGILAGTSQHPISVWGVPGVTDVTTLVDVSASIVPGDTFTLSPRDVVVTSTVQDVAGFFVEGDLDLSGLIPGSDYRLVVLTGPMTGSEIPIRNFGFPNNFWFETHQDVSGSFGIGDTYELRLFDPPPNRLKVGDTFSITQTFADWVVDKFAAGEVLAVDALTLEFGFNILATPELEVAPGMFAVAREDQVVFPPYPIETPPGDRDEFLLGTFENMYELGPFFFRPGDSVTARLHLDRSIPGGAFSTDNVDRILNWRVRFIDTYEGFSILGGLSNEGFPFGTPTSERAPEFDFDRDGASNVLEFALQTDVDDPNDRPTFQYALGELPGQCMATLTKRPAIGFRMLYFFEYSTNLVDWTTILPGDPNFDIVVDDETTLTVSNFNAVAGAFPPPSCFLRIRVELN